MGTVPILQLRATLNIKSRHIKVLFGNTLRMLRIAMNKTQIAELIQRRRLQLLVHSCIYYAYNENLVTDNTWAKWALELEKLQAQYPEIANKVRWAEAFKSFDHSTGYNLPFDENGIRSKAIQLLRYSEKLKDKENQHDARNF